MFPLYETWRYVVSECFNLYWWNISRKRTLYSQNQFSSLENISKDRKKEIINFEQFAQYKDLANLTSKLTGPRWRKLWICNFRLVHGMSMAARITGSRSPDSSNMIFFVKSINIVCLRFCCYDIKGVADTNINIYNINFFNCLLQAIKLWLKSSSYLRSCLFRKNWPIKCAAVTVDFPDLPM